MTLIAVLMISMTELLEGMGSGPTCLNRPSLSWRATMLSTISGISRLKSRSREISLLHSSFLLWPLLTELIIPPTDPVKYNKDITMEEECHSTHNSPDRFGCHAAL